jgi:endonuclease/exonuclease/phosphatase family metal-dependent hydrolase
VNIRAEPRDRPLNSFLLGADIETTAKEARGRLRRVSATCVWVASWSILALIVIVAILLQWAGDASWPMTLMTFGPRWMVLVPPLALVPPAVVVRRRALAPLGLAVMCGLVPVMGFCIPWRALMSREPQNRLVLRVATFNVGGGIDSAGMVRFFREFRPDIVAFQEWPPQLGYPAEIERDWHWQRHGELFIASRFPIADLVVSEKAGARWYPPAIRCAVETPAGTVRVTCVHLYTLRKGLDAVISRKWNGAPELERVTAIRNEDSALASRLAGEGDDPALVFGDFNATSESTIFRHDWSAWQDAFTMRGFGLGYTFNSRRIGLRIDHVLADKRHWQVHSCRVGPDLAGQHRPLVAELVLVDEAGGETN